MNAATIVNDIYNSISRNLAYCPSVKNVIYNYKDGTLATTVFFKDGSKVTVKNSEHDKVTTEKREVTLSDGTKKTIETASLESREAGLVYAIIKRIVCVPDNNGVVNGNGFATFLRKNVNAARMQDVERAIANDEHKIHKETVAKMKSETVAKKNEKPSLRKCVADLTEILDRLNSKLDK